MALAKRGQSQIPGQLKMFMTPSEIHEQYQPLDADRYENETMQSWQGTSTYQPPPEARGVGGAMVKTYDDMGNIAWRSQSGTKYGVRPETDEELWDRKRAEAYGESDDEGYGYSAKLVGGSPSHWSGGGYHAGGTPTSQLNTGQREARSWQRQDAKNYPDQRSNPSYYTEERYHPGTEGVTLGESIEAEGVKSPIRLGETVGSMGKKEIVGGHHRLAVATSVNPHQFLPVLHHEDIVEAKSNRAYPYT